MHENDPRLTQRQFLPTDPALQSMAVEAVPCLATMDESDDSIIGLLAIRSASWRGATVTRIDNGLWRIDRDPAETAALPLP